MSAPERPALTPEQVRAWHRQADAETAAADHYGPDDDQLERWAGGWDLD